MQTLRFHSILFNFASGSIIYGCKLLFATSGCGPCGLVVVGWLHEKRPIFSSSFLLLPRRQEAWLAGRRGEEGWVGGLHQAEGRLKPDEASLLDSPCSCRFGLKGEAHGAGEQVPQGRSTTAHVFMCSFRLWFFIFDSNTNACVNKLNVNKLF